MSITSTGTITGTFGTGLNARNDGTDLTVNTVDVFGGNVAMQTYNLGTGATNITSTGSTISYGSGVLAYNGASTTDLTITQVDVSVDVYHGIVATNYGSGATNIATTGAVTGGIYGFGIYSRNYGTDLVVSSDDVSAGISAISVINTGTGATSVSVTGNINGGSGSGIDTSTNGGNLTSINLASTSVVGATSGNAITNNFGDSIVNVASGATINGAVRLNDGSDTVNIVAANAFAGITVLDGGDDTLLGDGFVDVLNLNTAWSGNLNGANILNWEYINVNGGTVGFSNAAITVGQINVNNFGTLNGSNNLNVSGGVAVATGSRVIAGNAGGTNAMNVSGNMFNAGTVQLTGPAGQQAAGDTFKVVGN
ncbi:MAG: beta strand repeat-containing protein, partial [Arenimonas sp.]